MRHPATAVLATLLLTVAVVRAPAGQSSPVGTVRVATRAMAPFVFRDGDHLTGFSVDLCDALAERLKWKTAFQPVDDVNSLLAAVREKRADLGIAAVSITAEREMVHDFSQPMFDSGLQIMTRATAQRQSPMAPFLAHLISRDFAQLLLLIVILGLIPAHVVYFAERRNPTGLVAGHGYLAGIAVCLWWSVSTLATQADSMPRGFAGRVVAVVLMFVGVVFVAFFTASVTATMTVSTLQGAIQGPSDLPGKSVATTAGSTSAAYLAKERIHARETRTIEEAYDLLLSGQVDAVVFDAPVLLYYAAHEGYGRVQMVGSVFRKESYGIVFPMGSPLRKQVNAALLALQENGTYQMLYDRWFAGH